MESLIYTLGAGRPLLPERGKIHFSERMRCSKCNGVGAFIWPQDMKGPEPLFGGHGYQINRWFGDSILNTVATTSNVMVARAAYQSTIAEYPGRRITLQQRAYVVEDSRMKVIIGGKV